ncbi:MAG: hypothetical protein ACE5J4_02865 [Candidatus Aenigmatarchaeota archaeon]
MGEIRAKIELIGYNKSRYLDALLDSGAYRNYIKKSSMMVEVFRI